MTATPCQPLAALLFIALSGLLGRNLAQVRREDLTSVQIPGKQCVLPEAGASAPSTVEYVISGKQRLLQSNR